MDAAALAVWTNYGNKAELESGYLNVTEAPYNVTPSHLNAADDDGPKIQQAIYDAMRYGAVCYFPTGTYHISQQLSCPMPAILKPGTTNQGDILATSKYRCVLVGDRSGAKPVIKLRPNRPDFQFDANSSLSRDAQAKDVIHFWSVYIDDASPNLINENSEKPNSNFSHRMEYLKVDTNDNEMAAGVYMWGAQRCVIEDVDIDATNSFAGIRGIPGSGGMMRGVSVTGGLYGIYAVNRSWNSVPANEKVYAGGQAGATVVGATLIGQSVNNIYTDDVTGPMTIVGGHFEMSVPSSTNIFFEGGRPWLNLIDAQIKCGNSGTAIEVDGSAYLEDVYAQNASTFVYFPNPAYTLGSLPGNASGWKHVEEFCQGNQDRTDHPSYLYGSLNSGTALLKGLDTASPPSNLITKHWPPETALPYWEASNVNDIRDFGAIADDGLDDTTAIQSALWNAKNNLKDVFVPRGQFHISESLLLPYNVGIFGVEASYSQILAMEDGDGFFQAPNLNPLLQTQYNAAGTGSVSKVSFVSPIDKNSPTTAGRVFSGAYGVRWRLGEDSYVRDARFSYEVEWGSTNTDYMDNPYILIEGPGGGKWYGLHRPNGPDAGEMTQGYRALKVSNTTGEPLKFYMLNVTERTYDSPISMEIDEADNITIYSLKHENEGSNADYHSTALYAKDSANIRLLGYSGNATQESGEPMVELENCTNFILANLSRMSLDMASVNWDIFYDHTGDVDVSGEKKLLYYKRGNPVD